MKSAVETFETLLAERGESYYGRATLYEEYGLYLVDETPIRFVLTNGRGEPVSDDRDVNVQFMLMKDVLGFETVEDGEYRLATSKLDHHLTLGGLRLVTFGEWLVRVAREDEGGLLGFSRGAAPEGFERVAGTDFNVRRFARGEVTELVEFINGPRFRG